MEPSTRYNPKNVESKWYDHWMKKDYFSSVPDERESYTIVIPPPNVTGFLHMGHMLNNTIQDILIRKARLDGKNACWVPGTDHASIATEAKVVKLLREQGIKKSDIGREKFLEHAFEWKDKYGGIILEQLKRLGASCDWKRTRFTMEPKLSEAVIHVFVDLYKKNKLYRGLRMTNWDPEAKTVLSNEEVIYKEENSRLYFVRYQVEGTTDEWVTIATTRPETILGDTAVAINPDDERYKHLAGKKVIVPMVNRVVPIIQDNYVEVEFGTGCLKVTPAHDMNDYEIGQRHKLETIDVFNDDGTMSEAAGFYLGEDRFAVRKKIVKELEAKGHIVKIEDYRNNVGRSERTNAIVEPRLTKQWFLDMKDLAATALKAVDSGEVTFYPKHFWNMYYNWLNEDNVRDWCISRQLWWGQRIPAWYYGEEVFVAETEEAALQMAREKTGKDLTRADLKQEEDVVDTWFSSWLWPISVFDGFGSQEELKYYYPTSVLVTGWDIMFFWVARMIMTGYEYGEELLGAELVKAKGTQPFNDVYFTGMVRDEKRRKMSKSLGNSPDALALIENYGADGVRFGMMSSGAAGNDIIFDAPIDKETKAVLDESQLCAQGMKFCNKLWNALNMIKGREVVDKPASEENKMTMQWLEYRISQTVEEVEDHFKTYRLSDALSALYRFIWNDFCSWYLELIKPASGEPMGKETYNKTIDYFGEMMIMLHPFMPFITEELWHKMKERSDGEDCVISQYPKVKAYDNTMLQNMNHVREMVTSVREIRNKNGISPKEAMEVYVKKTDWSDALYAKSGYFGIAKKMGNLSALQFTETDVESTVSFVCGTEEYAVFLEQTIDVEAERQRIAKDLEHQKGFVNSIKKKLSNERFVNNAPAVVVDKEKQKLLDGEARIKILEDALNNLN